MLLAVAKLFTSTVISFTLAETNILLIEESCTVDRLFIPLFARFYTSHAGFLPSTVAPQNGWLEDDCSFRMASWQVRTVSFR